MSDFGDILQWAQAEAICNTLESNELSIWRSLCRSYSRKFSTPLSDCLDGTVPMEDILLATFEEQLEDFDEDKDLESILETISGLEDPEYQRSRRREEDEYAKQAEKEEEERLAAGKPIHPSLKGEHGFDEVPKELPKSGGVNFSYLKDAEE